MQIKFNKLVKPVAPQMDGLKPLDAINPAPAKPEPVQPDSPKKEAAASAPVESAPSVPAQAEVSAQPTAPKSAVPVQAAPTPAAHRPIGAGIEESLKSFIGQTIRVYMSDHESLNGRLEMVEDGWIKMSNVRSAGAEYYSDEDIISTANLVRAHTTRVIDKSYYVEFMNTAKK